MAYKKTFVPKTLIRSSEVNENSLILTNDSTATELLWIIGETPTGAIPGAIFTTAHQYQPNSISVYVDGIRIKRGSGVSEFLETSSTVITIGTSLVLTQDIYVDYIRKDI